MEITPQWIFEGVVFVAFGLFCAWVLIPRMSNTSTKL